MPRIPYTKPSITALEVEYASDAAANGWGDACYAYLDRFEHEFAQKIGSSWAVATSSGTGALHLGMAALGIGAGDEVILADSNWIATAAPIAHLQATPVFVDILPDTWCIDPDLAEIAITDRTKAIIATHLYGNLCDLDRLQSLCQRHGLYLIEDAAEAIGATYRGHHAGSVGAFGAFSFHGTKTITTGEGGALVTSNPEIWEAVRTLNNHGRTRDETRQFWPSQIGYKFRMSNMQAALGCGQLERWEELTDRKRWILNYYRHRLGDYEFISMNPSVKDVIEGAWMPNVVFSESVNVSRENLLAAFHRSGIDGRPFFWPLRSLPMFANSGAPGQVAVGVASRAINLPSFHEISEAQLEIVVETVLSARP